VDEAGRGCLAGPVYAAAVVWGASDAREAELRADPLMRLVRDSKKLSAAQRERARAFIEREALAFGVGCVSAAEVDRINVLRASMKAMRNALDDMRARGGPEVDAIIVDGDRFEGYVSPEGELVPYACVVDGDAQFLSVAAASVLAKTHRDRHVIETMHPLFPHYGWDRSKCYGTAAHYAAIKEHGTCVEHRRSFGRRPAAEPQRTEGPPAVPTARDFGAAS
jgi:ribonuclease HII